MKEYLLTAALSACVGSVAAWIVAWLKTQAPKIEATLDTADDWLAGKLHITLTDSWQRNWHEIVHGAVASVNKLALNERMWREVIRAVLSRDPAKAVTLQNELKAINFEAGVAAVEAALSPELKAIYNEIKEDLAMKTIAANATTTIGPENTPDVKEIRAAVRAVAPAHKPADAPVTADTIARLIDESKARQAALAK